MTRLTPKHSAPQHTGLHLSSRHATEHMVPDETPTVTVGHLSDLSVIMFFVSLLSCARSLKSKSRRWTTALPIGAVRHPTTGVKTSASRRMFGCPKTELNHLVAPLLVNEGAHGRDVTAFGLARSPRIPLTTCEQAPATQVGLGIRLARICRHTLGARDLQRSIWDKYQIS